MTINIYTSEPEPLSCCSASSCFSNDGKNVEEDVDDVSVECESSKDIFLWTQGQLLVAKQQLRIHCQELRHRSKKKK